MAVDGSVPDVQEVSLSHESWSWAPWAAHDGQSGLTSWSVGQGTPFCLYLFSTSEKKLMAEALFPHVLLVCPQFIQLLLFLWPPEEELDVVIYISTWRWSLTEVPEHQTWSVHTNSKRQPLPSITYSPNKQDRQKVREETEAQKKWRDSPAVTQQMIGRVRIRLIDHWINPLAKHTASHYFLGGKPGRMISLGWEP